MDRQIVYPGAIPLETDLLNTNKNAMIGLSKLAAAILGTSTFLNGLACTQTGPASLQVYVAPGEIYSLQNLDGTAYSSIAADTTHAILKQGLSLDQLTLSCPAPVTAGQSINYLIQATYQDTDASAVVLPYYNSSNPSQAYAGPANSGTAQNTVRKGVCAVSAKAGVAATTGTQTTPAPDAGYIGAFVVTVAYGQTQITAPNIAAYAGAPFLPSGGLVVGGLQGNACNVSAAGGTADAITGSYTPGITALTNGMTLYVRATSANATTTPTFTPNSGTIAAKQIVKGAGSVLAAGDIAGGGHWIELQYDATLDKWVLLNPAYGVTLQPRSKNLLINGAMRIAQAGTSQALTTGVAYGSLDGWAAAQGGAANGILAQVASTSGYGFQYAAKLGRNSGATQTGTIQMQQAIETLNSIPAQGQQVTLSFYAKAGANYSGGNLAAQVWTGTGTDQAVANLAGAWTGAVAPINASQAITTTWQRFSFTGTVSAAATQLGVYFAYTPTGTAGADDNVYITGVQLEIAGSASAFDFQPYQADLTSCQRQYEIINFTFVGDARAALASYTNLIQFKVSKRSASPAITLTAGTRSNVQSVGNGGANRDNLAWNIQGAATGAFSASNEFVTVDARL